MRAKHERAGQGVLGRMLDDEPVFVLRGRDALAARVVKVWANLLEHEAHERGALSPDVLTKAATARQVAHDMAIWHEHRLPD